MKSLVLALIVICQFCVLAYTQTGDVVLEVGSVNASNMRAGDEITIPIILNAKSEITISVLQLYINYDRTLLKWKGSHESPLSGVQNIIGNIPYDEASWVFNENEFQLVAFWNEPNLKGVEIPGKSVLFELIFTINERLTGGEETVISWGDSFEDEDGRLLRGETAIFDGNFANFSLNLVNGIVKF